MTKDSLVVAERDGDPGFRSGIAFLRTREVAQ